MLWRDHEENVEHLSRERIKYNNIEWITLAQRKIKPDYCSTLRKLYIAFQLQ